MAQFHPCCSSLTSLKLQQGWLGPDSLKIRPDEQPLLEKLCGEGCPEHSTEQMLNSPWHSLPFPLMLFQWDAGPFLEGTEGSRCVPDMLLPCHNSGMERGNSWSERRALKAEAGLRGNLTCLEVVAALCAWGQGLARGEAEDGNVELSVENCCPEQVFRKMVWACFVFLCFFLPSPAMSGYCHTRISHLNVAVPGRKEHCKVQYLKVGWRCSCFFRAYFPPYNWA